MSKRKTKYTLRHDGKTIELTKVIDGKRKHFYGKTDEEVEKKLADYIAALTAEPEKKVRTFEEVADAWWEEKEPTLSPNNVRSYKAHMKNAVEDLGSMPVDEITPQVLIAHLKKIAVQDYSQKVIKNRKSVIRSILNVAMIGGEIPSNPCSDLPIIKGKSAEPRDRASEEDIAKIEATKTDSNFSRMMYFMEYTGCRRGEAVALQEKDIDREAGKARICKAVAYREQAPIIKLPKTKAGIRDVDLYDNVLEILPKYEDPETYVFFPDGLPRKGQLERGLKNYQKENGISSTAHQLRHSYASMLHTANVDAKNAQHLLGHSSILVTEDIYTKIEAQNRADVRNQMNHFVLDRLNWKEKCCPYCGSKYTQAEDGHAFRYCPDCGQLMSYETSYEIR